MGLDSYAYSRSDYLHLNGMYTLRRKLHNGAPCWEKPRSHAAVGENEVRVLFRSADGGSWVIDEDVGRGGPNDLVFARQWTTSADPTAALEDWTPIPQLRVRAA